MKGIGIWFWQVLVFRESAREFFLILKTKHCSLSCLLVQAGMQTPTTLNHFNSPRCIPPVLPHRHLSLGSKLTPHCLAPPVYLTSTYFIHFSGKPDKANNKQ